VGLQLSSSARSQSLEQLTFGFIHQIVSFVYPQLCSLVKNRVKDVTISSAYYEDLIGGIGDENVLAEEAKKEGRN